MIRRDLIAEEAERRIAVSFTEIAEDLVERAVFLDDVDDVLDGRRVADFARDGIAGERGRVDLARLFRLAIEGFLGPLGELFGEALAGGKLNGGDDALHQAADVFDGAGGLRPAGLG